MQISVSSYSFQQLINSGIIEQADVVRKAHDIGFTAVEFTGLNGENFKEQAEYAKKIREDADKLGMEITAYTISADLYQPESISSEIDRIKKQLDIAKILGVNVLRHDACWSLSKTGNGRSFALMLPDISKAAREITAYAQTLGIKTCVENHGLIAQDSYRMEMLFNAVNHENFGLLIDMGNFVCADEDSASAVSRLAPYAIYVHAKDMYIYPGDCQQGRFTRGGNKFAGAAVGEGIIPVEQNLRILKLAGYDGVVSIEYEGKKDCIEGITTGFKNLKAFIENAEKQIG